MSQRFDDAADVWIEIEEARSIGETVSPVKRQWLAWSIAVLGVLIAASLAFVRIREKAPSAAAPMRFQIALPDKMSVPTTGSFAVSPDGRHLAFVGVGTDSVQRLWVRDLDLLEARPLSGTESPGIPPFFWSPDSRSIAFEAGESSKGSTLPAVRHKPYAT